MSFPTTIREDVLVRSHRRCCVCHDFAGRNVNVHHIIQEAQLFGTVERTRLREHTRLRLAFRSLNR